MRTASTQLIGFIRHLRESGEVSELPDRELVQRFADARDEAAFAALVRRHGAMVLGVCRRLLRHDQDAEDVFQAVFLVFSRKAGSLRNKEAVSAWLFGVARRLALRAGLARRKRRDREAGVSRRPCENPLLNLTVREAQAVLDEELANLPERERTPLVLCYLQGLTRDEAALRLGCPLGTLKSRLQRGRTALHKRLTRRGLALETVLGTTLLAGTSAYAVSPGLLVRTLDAGVAFAQRSATRGVVGATAGRLADEFLKVPIAGGIKLVAVCLLMTTACIGLSLSGPSGVQSLTETETGPAMARDVKRADPTAQPPELAQNRHEGIVGTGPQSPQRFLNLQPHANQKLAHCHGPEGNDLDCLSKGVQTMEEVNFNIGERMILLSGWTTVQENPEKVYGIDVDTTFQTLHILHATHWGGEPGARVAYYTVRYDDNHRELIPIRYGEDVNDWWHYDGSPPPSRAKVAWEGENKATSKCGATIRLYMTSWHNPHPARKVISIDFASANFKSKDSPQAAPFCVAMTIE